MTIIDKVYQAVNAVWLLPTEAPPYAADPGEITKDPIIMKKTSAVAMSDETRKQIRRTDAGNNYYRIARVKSEPDRIFGVRVLRDDSLPFGEVVPLLWGDKGEK